MTKPTREEALLDLRALRQGVVVGVGPYLEAYLAALDVVDAMRHFLKTQEWPDEETKASWRWEYNDIDGELTALREILDAFDRPNRVDGEWPCATLKALEETE